MIRGADLTDLRRDWQAQARRELLDEIDAWLLDEALADDADGAEWEADFVRLLRTRLAQRFRP